MVSNDVILSIARGMFIIVNEQVRLEELRLKGARLGADYEKKHLEKKAIFEQIRTDADRVGKAFVRKE
jgi:hypothetical protein